MRFVRPLKPWQVSTYRIAGFVFVVGFSALFWMVVLYQAMRMVG